jgi:cystatin-C
MRMSLLVVLLIAGATVLDAAAMAPGPALDNGWKAIKNITDPHVQTLGKWAVWKHTWVFNDGLRFSKVVSGEMQLVTGGVNYRLDVDALKMDDKHAMYKAEVFEVESTTVTMRKLVSFVPVPAN